MINRSVMRIDEEVESLGLLGTGGVLGRRLSERVLLSVWIVLRKGNRLLEIMDSRDWGEAEGVE